MAETDSDYELTIYDDPKSGRVVAPCPFCDAATEAWTVGEAMRLLCEHMNTEHNERRVGRG